MKDYRSKIGRGLVLFILILLGGISIPLILNRIWIGIFIILMVLGFIIYLFINIRYIISEGILIIKSPLLKDVSIEIQSIKKITSSSSIISSPAASFDRLEIFYNKFDTILVSPKEKGEFIDSLKEVNPSIVVLIDNL